MAAYKINSVDEMQYMVVTLFVVVFSLFFIYILMANSKDRAETQHGVLG
uniref:Uncharacterized protein n=1 Tax=viral metagenome TaxID=1070528 RepID=A0A6C0HMU3_9ZZZZ